MARGNALRRLSVFVMERVYEQVADRSGHWEPEIVREALRQCLATRSIPLGRPLDTVVIHSVFPSGITAEQAVDTWMQWVFEKPVAMKSKTGHSSTHAAFLALCQSGEDPRWRDSRIERAGDAPLSCLVPEFAQMSDRLGETATGTDESTVRLHVAGGVAVVPDEMSVWDALHASPRQRGDVDARRSAYEVSSLLRALESAQDIWRHIAALGLYPPDWAREFDHDGNENFLSRHEANILRGLQIRFRNAGGHEQRDPGTLARIWDDLAAEQAHDKQEKKRNWRRLPAGFDTPEAFAASAIGQAVLEAAGRVREVSLPDNDSAHGIDPETPERILLEGPEQAGKHLDLLASKGDLDDVERVIIEGIALKGLEIPDLIQLDVVAGRFGTEEKLTEFVETLTDRLLASPLR